MFEPCFGRTVGFFCIVGLVSYQGDATTNCRFATGGQPQVRGTSFAGSKAGDERAVAGIKLGWCPPGQFRMGSPGDEPERRPGEDQVDVTLSKGFWIGKFEVTQEQWRRVVGEFPGQFTAGEGNDFPVYTINFAEAEGFCQKLTERAHASGDLPREWEFRLPTEAQWEYACRAGTTTATSFGDKLSSKQANFQGKPYNGAEEGPSLKRAARVGSYPANPWGLHDMHGNVFEWCRDWYHSRLPGGADPDLYSAKSSATKSGNGDISRVRRGGCWADEGWPCRSAFRLRFEPERRHDHIGFRVVAVNLLGAPSYGPGSGGGIGESVGTGPDGSAPSTYTPDPNAPPRTVDQKPVLLNNPSPLYTEQARRNAIQGIVAIRILVGADGLVKRANIVRGLPDGLDEQAVKAVYKLRFKPAMKDGQPVPFWMSVQIEFKLRDGPQG